MNYEELTKRELWELLFQRTEMEMAAYVQSLNQLSRDERIMTADNISAMMTCRSELMVFGEDLPREEMLFLLRQEKPLEILSEAWRKHQNVDVGETLQSLLDDLCRDESNQVREPAHQTVKELLEAYPHGSFQLMTPSGFVDLTPNETEILLRGEAVMAHPGAHGYELPVPAEEILEFEIETLKRGENGRWYALVGTPAPQMDASEQGFQMNL